MLMKVKIGFIGLGKLGLDCAEVFAEHYATYGFDVEYRTSKRVKILNNPRDLINTCDWIFIAVPTPHQIGYDGSVPSSHLEPQDFDSSAVISALEYVRDHALTAKNVVLISTVLPGTTRQRLKQHLGDEYRHRLFYNPYLIAMGSVKWDMVNPEMVIIGTENGDSGLAGTLQHIYRPLMKNNPRYVSGTWEECESIKIFYNTFISAKIGLVNMIQDFAMKIGNIDVDVVTDALAKSTTRIVSEKYMTAGLGDAGACVLPNFLVSVDGQTKRIEQLYNEYLQDPHQTRLIDSTTYACTTKDQKKIDRVTCRHYSGEMIKFILEDAELITTPEHLIPVIRQGQQIILRADQIVETDNLIRILTEIDLKN